MDEWINVIAPYNVIYDTYIDEHEIVKIDEKQPQLGKIGILVAGDAKSQFMTFEINRYYDNIDLSNKLIKITYLQEKKGKIVINENTKIYADNACNICYTDDKLRFSWLIPAAATTSEGTIAAAISFIGLDTEKDYELKTTIFELTIEPSINGNATLETVAKVTWFGDIESRIYILEQNSGLADLDYETLINKPTLNGETIDGDMVIDFSPMATATTLGSVKVVPKTDAMTALVGISEDGLLYAQPGGGGGGTGQDGFSPLVSFTPQDDGTLLTIVDKNGPKTTLIKNGEDGADGTDGVDGSSVTVATEAITGGNKVTFTDKDGDKEITILNGINGINGKDGKDGSALIDDTATSGSDKSWSIDKIIAYTQKVLEDIEDGTY